MPERERDDEAALEAWIALVLNGERDEGDDTIHGYRLPSDGAADLLIRRIDQYDEDDVIAMVRELLMSSTSLGVDEPRLEWIRSGGWRSHLTAAQRAALRIPLHSKFSEYERRLMEWASLPSEAPPPWEGITWVLDLLPQQPQLAIDAVNSYTRVHAQILPDGRFVGMTDALALIRARFVGAPGVAVEDRRQALLALPPPSFERLIERYMHERGYTTTLTPRSNDGGFDLIADRATPPPAHRVLVECKNWTKKVDRPKSQQLLGNLSAQKAPNGLMVTTSGVSAPARKFAHENPRIALLDGEELIRELNLVLGHNWPARIDRLLLESERDCPEQSVRALSERG